MSVLNHSLHIDYLVLSIRSALYLPILVAVASTHERWLDQEEEYMQEQRLFYQTTSSYNTVPLMNIDSANIFTSLPKFSCWPQI